MKVLLCIISWVEGCRIDANQAQRDTFLKDVAKFPNLDYKIFIGDGTPTGDDEYDINKTFEATPIEVQRSNALNRPKVPFDYVPKEDEVVVHAPDDIVHIAYKSKAAWKWALDNGYDYIFHCFYDTYIDIERLMSSGFEGHYFSGMTYDTNLCPLGGAGYWMNKKCLEIMTTSHVDFWAEDGWAGWTLQKHGIYLHHDARYRQHVYDVPTKKNDFITVHVQGRDVLETCSLHSTDRMRDIYKGLRNDNA